MNPLVRDYLIKIARQRDKFVYYSNLIKECRLDIDLNTPQGQSQLKQLLVDISRFENSHQRPMLTAIAIGKKDNDHGNGFYDLAEEFGFGNNEELHAKFWGMEEAERVRNFWQDETNFARFANLLENKPLATEPPFFSKEELDFFIQWQYRGYDKGDPEHVAAKNYLMDTVWEKSIYLCQQIVTKLDRFDVDARKVWHQRGWKINQEGHNVQAAIFKPYTWVKIFRERDNGKDIFFTFGVDAEPEVEAFIYKIDCQRERDHVLSQAQIELVDSLIPETARWNEISFDNLLQYNWETLTALCLDFISKHLAQYDAIIQAVWGADIQGNLFFNTLVRRDRPDGGYDSIPEAEPKFEGYDTDFEEKNRKQKDLGDKGEELVRLFEINFLKKAGLNELAEQIKIAKDGEGFDVLSFDLGGNKKHIEVKTTTGPATTPFFLSENEVLFMRKNLATYSIYRVYNYDQESNFGEFFEITANFEDEMHLKPVVYKVLLKNKVVTNKK